MSTKRHKPILAFDFDGVIADSYASGRYERNLNKVRPFSAAKPALAALIDAGWQVSVYTARATTKNAAAEVILWLNEYDIPFHEVTATKPHALAFIDDRAIRFDNWQQALVEISRLNVIEAMEWANS